MENREQTDARLTAGQRSGAYTPQPVSADGTREYRPHSTPHAAGPLSAEMSVAETRVYRTLRDRLQGERAQIDGGNARTAPARPRRRDTLPGLAYSGEQPHPTADGSLGMSDRVVREEVRRREEFPYG